MKPILFLIIFSFFSSTALYAQNPIPLAELEKHIGDTVTICDSVVQTTVVQIIPQSIGDPRNSTGLSLEGKGCPFKLSVGIDNTKVKFSFKPDEVFNHKRICVTGILKKSEYWSILNIELIDPKQIHIQAETDD